MRRQFTNISTTYLKHAMLVVAVIASGCSTLPPDNQKSGFLPKVVAHRAGTKDAPENTKLAALEAVRHGADIMWLTVQLSKDGVPVLYRPADLSAMTQAKGPVATKTVQELKQLNAGWHFKRTDSGGQVSYPYRNNPAPIPTLEEVLDALPETMPVVLDMKALPAQPQVDAVAALLTRKNAWSRVSIYSTEAVYQQAFRAYPQATVFESRDGTRGRLVKLALALQCDKPTSADPVGFEYKRDAEVVEKFTLGEGRSPVKAQFWTSAAVRCFREQPNVKIIAFGINSIDDYKAVACMGVDAVLADSPLQMQTIRANLSKGMDCSAR